MARLNPKRRRYAQQAELIRSITDQYGPSHDDSAKLQRGSPKTTSGSKFARNGQYATTIPRATNIEGRGPAWYKDGTKSVYQGNK